MSNIWIEDVDNTKKFALLPQSFWDDFRPAYKMAYLSGAITGHDKAATERKFAQAEREARRLGYAPVNPLNNGLPDSATYEQHMERDLEMLRECGAVLMLPDWEESPGARRELREAIEHDKKIIFYKPQNNNKVMENLMNCDGLYFKAKIDKEEITGRIRVENGGVYLCQDQMYSINPKKRLGHKYGWGVFGGTPKDLKEMSVTDFHLMTQEEAKRYKDWHVGDIVEGEEGDRLEIIFRSGEMAVVKTSYGNAKEPYTCEELYRHGYRLVLPDAQIEALKAEAKPIREVTMDEIAEKFGVAVGELKIKKD